MAIHIMPEWALGWAQIICVILGKEYSLVEGNQYPFIFYLLLFLILFSPSKIDQFSRCCFPILFIIFNIIYWQVPKLKFNFIPFKVRLNIHEQKRFGKSGICAFWLIQLFFILFCLSPFYCIFYPLISANLSNVFSLNISARIHGVIMNILWRD